MYITSIYPNIHNKNSRFGIQTQQNSCAVSKFSHPHLITDTVSFGAMKKSEFSGVDLLVVEKFNAPVEKFKTNDDFLNWAQTEIDKKLDVDYTARSIEAEHQRTRIIDDWRNYLENENKEYSISEKLLIYDGITKNLRGDNDDLPPVLSKAVLADTISRLEESLKEDPKMSFNFNKTYTNNLRKNIFEENKTELDITGWMKIPSKKHDSKNFDKNVEKLKILSHPTWCTKSFNAKPYLERGDFHIYFEQGQPKLAVRFDGDKIVEIEGEKNDSKIPQKYLSTFEAFIKDNKYSNDNFSEAGKRLYNEAIELRAKITEEKNMLKDAGISLDTEDNDYEKLFNYYGIETSRDENGMLILSHFDEPQRVTFEELGIDGNKLLKNVSKITGNAKFCRSEMTDIGSVEEIGGHVNLEFSKVRTLGHLKKIGGDFETGWDNLKDTGDLEEIGGSVTMHSWAGYEFKKVKRVGGNFDIGKINIFESLGSIEEIGGSLLKGGNIADFGNLRIIGKDADFEYLSPAKPFNIEKIGGNANFTNANIKFPLSIKEIGGNMMCKFADFESFGALETIGGDLYLGGADVNDFGAIKKVKGEVTALNEVKRKLSETMRANKKQSFWDKVLGRNKEDEIRLNSFEEEDNLITLKTVKEMTKCVIKSLGNRDKSKQ